MNPSIRAAGMLLALLVLVLPLWAGIREQSVFVEGEDFVPTNDDWTVREGWGDDIYTATSGNAVIANQGGGKGEASREVVIPAAGEYRVWVRYLKIGTYAGSFGLRLSQNGQVVFDQRYRTKPEGGDWRDVWEQFPAQLAAGPATLTLYLAQGGIRQRVDCVLLTPDASYKPRFQDFAPQTFVRFRLLEPAVPATAEVNTYLKRAPVYYYHPGTITTTGLVKGGAEIPAGEWSPWVDFGPFMDGGKWLTTIKLAFASGGKPLESLKLEYQLASTADGAGAVTLKEDIDGHISSLILPGDIRKFADKVELASACTARHMAI